jgi:hypothetical protein
MQKDARTIQISVKSIKELCLFLVASAEGLFQEPREYGPLRLLQAVRRIAQLLETQGSPDQFLDDKAREIDQDVVSLLEQPTEFQHFVSRLVLDFSRHLTQEE